jgi:hypothetical protein
VAAAPALGVAIIVVIVLNALFAFAQEQQAERAVARYLPAKAKVLRDGRHQQIEVRELVPGGLLLVEEGDRISADARLLEGAVEIDLSALTGESLPVYRSAGLVDTRGHILNARDLLFGGTTCTQGEARALVFATGMQTELAGSRSCRSGSGATSPLERQVTRVAWVIALVAVAAGLAFLPLGRWWPACRWPMPSASRSACWSPACPRACCPRSPWPSRSGPCPGPSRSRTRPTWAARPGQPGADPAGGGPGGLQQRRGDGPDGASSGDPTEIALLRAAAAIGADPATQARERDRRAQFHFDPALRLMSTLDQRDGALWVDTKGAPEEVVARSRWILAVDGARRLGDTERTAVAGAVDGYARQGLRLLAVAQRATGPRGRAAGPPGPGRTRPGPAGTGRPVRRRSGPCSRAASAGLVVRRWSSRRCRSASPRVRKRSWHLGHCRVLIGVSPPLQPPSRTTAMADAASRRQADGPAISGSAMRTPAMAAATVP